MSAHGLTLDRLAAGYTRPVVSDASLAVAPGEIVGLIGPNGAGKTTLVRAVSGEARIFAGTVQVAGRPAGSFTRREFARVVGVLPQATPAAFPFSSRQYVEMGRHAHVSRFGGLTGADSEAVDRAMSLTGTTGLAEAAVDTLSGGDLQRLTLAQTLAQEPDVLLLDEPTSHLDLNHRLQVLDVVRALADDSARPLAVLAVFHDLDMAARYADRLAVVSGGALGAADVPERVLTAAAMEDVFGVRAVIATDPVTGAVQVVPVVRTEQPAAPRGVRVAVISGSGTGAAVMRRLVLAGFGVSAGALSRGDTDERVAEALEVQFTPLAPFGAMSDEDGDAVLGTLSRSDVVVVCATPFGPANVGNLRAVALAGRPVVLVGDAAAQGDFTHGEAALLLEGLARDGAVVCDDARQVTRCVEEAIGR